ncbi:MAG: hypothetical protein LW855_01340 [Alphaproteobacteria bacterium]|jgi:hypothetical protein|nr:hypothetical protein [Thalassospira sp.]MCE2964421.1 hypothetical protein [Alphaproteobacteria bacterium]
MESLNTALAALESAFQNLEQSLSSRLNAERGQYNELHSAHDGLKQDYRALQHATTALSSKLDAALSQLDMQIEAIRAAA